MTAPSAEERSVAMVTCLITGTRAFRGPTSATIGRRLAIDVTVRRLPKAVVFVVWELFGDVTRSFFTGDRRPAGSTGDAMDTGLECVVEAP